VTQAASDELKCKLKNEKKGASSMRSCSGTFGRCNTILRSIVARALQGLAHYLFVFPQRSCYWIYQTDNLYKKTKK
jgi:hypothetical protein